MRKRIIQVIGLMQYIALWLLFYFSIIPHLYYSVIMHVSAVIYTAVMLWMLTDGVRIIIEWAKYDKFMMRLLIIITLMITVTIPLEYIKYIVLNAYAWDLGIFMQSLYSTAFYNKLFYYTVELFFNPGGSFFGVHFSPILFIITPVYYLAPTPLTLYVIQSIVVYTAALPLYLLVDYLTRDKLAAFITALLYIFNPGMGGLIYFDFHVEAFIALLYFLMMLEYARGRFKAFLTYALLFMLTIEYTQVISLALALGLIINKPRKLSYVLTLIALTLTLMAVIPPFMVWLNPLKPHGLGIYNAFTLAGYIGNPIGFIPYVIHHPNEVIHYLTADAFNKFSYFIVNLLPLFPAFYNPLILQILPYMFLALLNDANPAFYSNLAQYAAYFIPMAFTAYAYALRSFKVKARLIILMLSFLIAINAFIFFSPLSPFNYHIQETMWWYTLMLNAPQVQEFYRVASLIPSNASILTVNNLFPHFANRLNAFASPMPLQNWPNYHVAFNYVAEINATYILIPKYEHSMEEAWLMKKALTQDYKLIVNSTYYLLYIK